MKPLLGKQKENGKKEFTTVYFSSATKTVIIIKKSCQQVLHRLDNWINEESTLTIEYIDRSYINISIYSLFSGNTDIELPDELKHPLKELINIKSDYNKYFLWCHIRHSNP